MHYYVPFVICIRQFKEKAIIPCFWSTIKEDTCIWFKIINVVHISPFASFTRFLPLCLINYSKEHSRDPRDVHVTSWVCGGCCSEPTQSGMDAIPAMKCFCQPIRLAVIGLKRSASQPSPAASRRKSYWRVSAKEDEELVDTEDPQEVSTQRKCSLILYWEVESYLPGWGSTAQDRCPLWQNGGQDGHSRLRGSWKPLLLSRKQAKGLPVPSAKLHGANAIPDPDPTAS